MDQTSHSGLPFGVPLPARPPREAIDALLREDPVRCPLDRGRHPDARRRRAGRRRPPAAGRAAARAGDRDRHALRQVGPVRRHAPVPRRGLRARDLRLARPRQVRGRVACAHDRRRRGRARRRGVGGGAGVVQRRRRRHGAELQRLGRVGDDGGATAAPARRRLDLGGRALAAGAALHLRLLLALLGLLVRARAPPHPGSHPRPPGAAADAARQGDRRRARLRRARAGRSSSSTTRWTSSGRAAAGTAPTTSTSRRCT